MCHLNFRSYLVRISLLGMLTLAPMPKPPSAWINFPKSSTGQSGGFTGPSARRLNSNSEWRMSCPPLTFGPHLSYARKWRSTSWLKQPQAHLTLSFLIFLPLSRKQEQGRTRERKWRLEMKEEGEVKTCDPRSSSLSMFYHR